MESSQNEFLVRTRRVLCARRWQVFRMLLRTEEYPFFLPQIRESRLIERTKRRARTHWKVDLENIPFTWDEEATFDFRNFLIRFRAVAGDLEKFEGTWKLTELPSGDTEIACEAVIKLGIPVFEAVAGEIVAEKVRRFFDALLEAFEEELVRRRYHGAGNRSLKRISGFGVIGHPYNLQHLAHFFETHERGRAIRSREFLAKIFELTPSFEADAIKEFRDSNGKTVNGSIIICNIIPDMLDLDIARVVDKVVDACKLAERRGFGIVALGGFTSIAGERCGDDFLKRIHIPVTTGNTFTAALALEQVQNAARLMELDLGKANVTILGGAGDIGSACARGLADKVGTITVTSLTGKSFRWIKQVIAASGKAKVRTSLNNRVAVRKADIVIAAASAHQSIIDVRDLKPGAIVCDIGYPKNISYSESDRRDILVFSGGICEMPCEFQSAFDHGLPTEKVLYGCFAEAIVLALEERFERFSWGKGNITKQKMAEILGMAARHGFRPAPFFWGSRLMSDDEVRAVAVKA